MLLHRIFIIRFFMACLLGLPLLAFAASPSAASPEGAIKEYYELVAANRAEEAIEFYSIKNIKDTDLTEVKSKLKSLVEVQYKLIQGRDGLKAVETKLISQKGDKAFVECSLVYGNGKKDTEKTAMIREDGRWKFHEE
ncbi:MAG: hypothetical protein LBP52_09270 [Burkholderiaceae bacterium]|jgi:hypothetical protein|nr:hypothetical protein [Burkholderiaceae bacterium]